MKAYAIDRRERIVRSVQAGRSQSGTARVFGIGVSTVTRSLQQQREHGSLAPKPIPGAARPSGPEHEEALRAQLQAHCDATLEQHCARWAQNHQGVSVATRSRALARLRWPHKKSRSPRANATRRLGKPGAKK